MWFKNNVKNENFKEKSYWHNAHKVYMNDII